MEILNSLREGTGELHREIEKDNIANKIMDHSISLDEYKLLLFQNYIAYKTAESEIQKFLPDYGRDKTGRLQQDLAKLGVVDLSDTLNFKCENEAEVIGAAYVIEGSTMGGMLIGKEIRNCDALKNLAPQQFFNGERSSMSGWNKYLKYLRSNELNDQEISFATEKAKDTFLLFKEAFSLELSGC